MHERQTVALRFVPLMQLMLPLRGKGVRWLGSPASLDVPQE